MNTRQKLTLGIAAIFMVTLTIVGVTYAYFVTQVEKGTEAAVNVSTATFGDVEFVKEDDGVTLNSMALGESESTTFQVRNTGDSQLFYDLVLRYEEDESTENAKPKFIRSLATKDGERNNACYNLDDSTAAPTACTTGAYYDNVIVKIERDGNEVYNGPLEAVTPNDIEKKIPIVANGVHNYTITVTHANANMNQNLEQDAYIKVIPDIDSIDAVTVEPDGE